MLEISYSSGSLAPYINFLSPNQAYAYWGFTNTTFRSNATVDFNGTNVDFTNANVTGLTARFG